LVVDDDDNDARMDSLCTSFNELQHAEVGWHLNQTSSQGNTGNEWGNLHVLQMVIHSFIHQIVFCFCTR
jgi:hypothetical protein